MKHVTNTFGGGPQYDLTRLAADRQRITVESLRYTDVDGLHKQGVQRFVWLPSAAANHTSGPASGFVMVVANPSKTPADPRVFHRDKFYWATHALRVPREWVNSDKESFYDILKKNPEKIRHALKTGLGDYTNLSRGSAFMGVYASNRRENGWLHEAWIVVQCGDRGGSLGVFASLKRSSVSASEIREAKILSSSADASGDEEEKEKEEGEDEETSDNPLSSEEVSAPPKKRRDVDTINRILGSAKRGEDTWTTCFGPLSQLRKLNVTAANVRREYILNLMAALGFALKGHQLDAVPLQVETAQNFVRFLPSANSWAYYGGVTCIYSDTRAVVLHERPLRGMIILTGRPTAEHPLGETWPKGPEVLGGAFPYSTGRVRPLFGGEEGKGEKETTTASAFFTREETRSPDEELHPRLSSELYRSRDAKWMDLEYAMGRPETGGEIHLKPLMVLCAPRPTKRVGLLKDLLS